MRKFYHSIGIFYAVLGFTAAACSYYVQSLMLASIMGVRILAYLIVLGMEGVKTGSILNAGIDRYSEEKVRPIDSFRVQTLRTGLIITSIVFTMFWLATSTHLPNADAMRAEDLAREKAAYQTSIERINRTADHEAEGIRKTFAEKRGKLDAKYEHDIAHFTDLIDRETDNVVGGVFEGKRYKSYVRRKREAEANYRTDSAALLANEHQSIEAVESRRRADLMAAEEAYSTASKSIENDTYEENPLARHQLLSNFALLVNDVFGTSISTNWIVFPFSFFLAVINELVIIESFTRLGEFFGPWIAAYRKYHRSVLEIGAEAAIDSAEDSAELNRTRTKTEHAAENIFKEVEDVVSLFTKKSPHYS